MRALSVVDGEGEELCVKEGDSVGEGVGVSLFVTVGLAESLFVCDVDGVKLPV